MTPFERYKMWLKGGFLSPEDREELEKIKDNKKEIEERFYGELEFGTGGIRGIMGLGSMRMNVYNIGRVSQAIAKYIKDKGF
ncbi:MAG TPA: phospho-sugar mutase, partial [Candidatus Atribacteria bacterium]|nr:phospho-sugar mutase [Candidatus Atribacteria bacterium]